MLFFKYIFLCFLCAIGFLNPLLAQPGKYSPIDYNQFFQNYFLVNPASSDSTDKVKVALGNRTFSGLLEGVNRVYADGSLRLKHGTNENFSRVGLLFMSNHDGDFINNSRIYGRYSWSTGLTEKSALSAGLSLGFINYIYKGSQASAGGSASSVDGNLGIWYIRKKISVGLSYQQIFRSVFQPVEERFTLQPFYNLNFIFREDLSPYIHLTTHFYLKYQSLQSLDFQLAPVFLFNEKFEGGLSYQSTRGVAVMLGLTSIKIGSSSIGFMGSFLLSTKKLSNTSDSVIEFSANYSF